MVLRFSAMASRLGPVATRLRLITDRRPFRAVALAVAGALLLTTAIVALTGGPELHAKGTPAARAAKVPGPEVAAELILDEAGLVGEFSFVLYDAVEDRYLLSYRPDQVQFSQSTAKLLIAVGALQRGADPSRVAEMLTWSDDPIANELWGLVEGPVLTEELAATMGLEHTTPSPEWGRWGDTMIAASDMVRIYEYLLDELPEGDRTVILDALAATTAKGSDGFDQTFGLPTAAAGLDWAVKQGWGCCKPDRFLVSTGAIGADRRYIATIFGAWDETQVGEAQAAEEMTTVAAAVIDRIPGEG